METDRRSPGEFKQLCRFPRPPHLDPHPDQIGQCGRGQIMVLRDAFEAGKDNVVFKKQHEIGFSPNLDKNHNHKLGWWISRSKFQISGPINAWSGQDGSGGPRKEVWAGLYIKSWNLLRMKHCPCGMQTLLSIENSSNPPTHPPHKSKHIKKTTQLRIRETSTGLRTAGNTYFSLISRRHSSACMGLPLYLRQAPFSICSRQ